MTILSLPGPAALTAFARRNLLRELSEREPGVISVDAVFIHFVELSSSLGPEDEKVLQRLLHYGAQPENDAGDEGETAFLDVLVTPRPGTISPWSSKAGNIIHRAVCGPMTSRNAIAISDRPSRSSSISGPGPPTGLP